MSSSRDARLTTHDSRPKTRVVGRPYPKVDAFAKVTGQTRFADDLFLPRMLHCKLLRSTHAHARIVSIDASRALAMPGVVAVATGKDLPIAFGILPVSQDEHALCTDRVRFVGDPVAAVAAVDEDAAFEALDAIEVVYEPLDTIASIDEAVAKSEPRIHDYGDAGNFHKLVSMEFGDVEGGFSTADRVYEDLFFYEGNTHLALEQHAALADWGPDGKLTLWSSTQTPHYVHRALAKVLELPAARIRVIATPNGGGFGGKSDPFNHEIVVAHLSRITGRPVKICLTREEVFYCHRGRHPTLMRVKTGVKSDGGITAMHFQSALDGGGYGSYGVASTYYTGALQTVTYRVPAYRFDGARVFTNKPPCGPKRGHGTPQPRYALEVHLDKIACDLGLDPARMRLAHLAPANTLTANFLRVGSMGLGACIEKVVEASGWRQRRGQMPPGRGLGLACSSYITGAGLPIYWNAMPQSGVQLKLDRSGGLTVFCGSTEIGQGSDTILAAIVAEVLGVDPFDIRIVTGDTDLTPVDLGSYSSRVTLMTGNAALQAAERARDLLAGPVARKLEVPGSRLVFADGRVFDAEEPEKGMTFAEAVVTAESAHGTLGTVGSYSPPPSAGRYRGAGVGPSPAYSYSAAVVEVEVDLETGITRVPKIWIAHDVGKCINPVLVVGQVEGSVYMGLGEAAMEEMAYRGVNGNVVHKFPSMLEYKSPTTKEMCDVETYLIEDPDPNGPFGAKEVGQGPLLPIPPAFCNAIFDAVGVRVDEIPATPEKIFRALQEKAKGGEGRIGPTRFPAIPYPEPIHVPTPDEGGDGRAVDAGATGAGGVRGAIPGGSGAPMMRLPKFRYLVARSVEEAVAMKADAGDSGAFVAGGTDLYPNMKRRQQTPATVIGLSRVAELSRVGGGAEGFAIGSAVSLSALERDPRIQRDYPGLAHAIGEISTPPLRNMGTLGGNVLLDTRCNYYDQNYEWRKAIDFCMKKDGEICWVAPGSPKCLAVQSADSVPVLVAMGARAVLRSVRGEREIDVGDLYRNDGIDYLTKQPDELLTEIRLPAVNGWKASYRKLRRRGAFDFPVLSVGAFLRFDGGRVAHARLVLGGVASSPIRLEASERVLAGRPFTDDAIRDAGTAAAGSSRPMDNTDFSVVWRKRMTAKFVELALKDLV